MADPAWDVLCVGEALWDFHAPNNVRLDMANQFSATPGGGAVNTAVALAGLGRRAALCAAVGDDPLGRGLVAHIAKAGVDTRYVRASQTLRTGLLFAGPSDQGGPQFLSYRTPQDEGRQMGKALPEVLPARALHLSGLLPIPAQMRTFRAAFRAAEVGGRFSLLDVNARPRFWDRPDMHAVALLERAYWVKASRADFTAIRSSPEALRARMRPSMVLIVTQGAEHVLVSGAFGSFSCRVESVPNAHPLASIGAGDAFCAGVLDGALAQTALREMSLEAVLAFSEDGKAVREVIERGISAARAHIERRTRQASEASSSSP